MRTTLLIVLTFYLLISCKPVSKEQKVLDAALEAYKQSPDDNTSKAFATAYNAYRDKVGYEDPAISNYMLEGARIAEKRQKLNTALSWYQSYFTRHYGDPEAVDHYFEMTSLIEAFGKPELSQVFYKSLVKRFPSHPGAEAIKAKIADPSLSIDSSLQFVLKSIPNESTSELNTANVQLYMEMVEVSVMTDTTLYLGADHLAKAGEVGRMVKLYTRSIKLYDWVIRLYPTHRFANAAIFMKAYINYFDLKDYDKANELIKEYQAKDPYGQFEFEANYLLNNPGKTEEELMKAIAAQL